MNAARAAQAMAAVRAVAAGLATGLVLVSAACGPAHGVVTDKVMILAGKPPIPYYRMTLRTSHGTEHVEVPRRVYLACHLGDTFTRGKDDNGRCS